jgi:hypothetical protein
MTCCGNGNNIHIPSTQKTIIDLIEKKVDNSRTSSIKSNRSRPGTIARQCPNCGTKTIVNICPICSTIIPG